MLRIELKKHTGGACVVRCVRADQSETWQKQERHAAFFVTHDLTHFAVESILGFRKAFWGLIDSGWSFDDTTGKGPRGKLPAEAIEVESLTGMLDMERAGGTLWTAGEFNEALRLSAERSGRPAPRELTDADLFAIRARRSELVRRWNDLPPGQTMELEFDSGG